MTDSPKVSHGELLFDARSNECMCLAFDADSNEEGWRPCPANLCEREDHEHHPDWLVAFSHKVAVEQDDCSRHPGHAFCVMLNRKEAEGLLQAISDGYARNDDGSLMTPEQSDA